MADGFGKKGATVKEAPTRSVGWNAASIIFVLILFAILAATLYYLYGMNPGWNPFKGIGPSSVRNGQCTMRSDCHGSQICISGRSCMCGPDVQYGGSDTCTCQCGGSTGGVCVDYSGTPAAGKECGLQGHACSMGPGLAEQAPLCCPGDVCVDGICTAPGGGWLAKCRIVED